ncbi:MAG: hypothetical protein Q8L92_03085, partial [Rubrivivax sp.]|nr:hypothetical protein [Rubrivivax sp.]
MQQHVAFRFTLVGGFLGAGRHYAAFDQRTQARLLRTGTHGIIGVQHILAGDRILHRQQCRCDFQIHLFARIAFTSGGGTGRTAQLFQQAAQPAALEHMGLRLHAPQVRLELFHLCGIALDIGMPAVVRTFQAGLQCIQHRSHARQRLGIKHATSRQVTVEAESRAHFRRASVLRLAFRDKEQS